MVEQPLSALLHLSVGWEKGQSPQLPDVDLQLLRLGIETAKPVMLEVILEDPPPVDVAAAKKKM